MDLVGAGGALTIFTLDGLPFNGTVTSIPFTNGNLLSGPDPVAGYYDDGGTDVLVAYVKDRTLTAVPEPGSAVPAGIAAAALGAVLARPRRARTR